MGKLAESCSTNPWRGEGGSRGGGETWLASGCDLKLVPSPFPDGMWAVKARERMTWTFLNEFVVVYSVSSGLCSSLWGPCFFFSHGTPRPSLFLAYNKCSRMFVK